MMKNAVVISVAGLKYEDVERRYFTETNACKIDAVVKQIHLWEDAIDITKIMIGALGYKVFSPKRMPVDTKESNEPVLYMERFGAKASGQRIPDGFVVFKGSTITKATVKSCPEIAIKYRQKYVNSIDENFILKEDLVFSSPSSAAAFVGGSSLSGNELWKTEDGVSLKKLES